MTRPSTPEPPTGSRRLGRGFFARPSPLVARELLGTGLVRRLNGEELRVRVCETEAYLGRTDPASHAFRGQTRRNSVMFGKAGVAYVYFVYGMHHCFNVVTGSEGDPQAVLVRAAVGGRSVPQATLQGPARLCRALAIDLASNGLDLCQGVAAEIWFEAATGAAPAILTTARVGVRDPSPLRFVAAGPSPDDPRGRK
ncbi:MAG TPA: DNA-3-methyladenine glycosylase [Candidatus Dormibacteraeota bacterium]|nr:DNA-3-methyladenine glycosylase [Candidatus Dormibacteraeota bacterium]